MREVLMESVCFMEPYATHQVPTITAAMRSGILWPELPILELGCGHYSTPLLASVAKAQERKLHIITSDPIWAKHFEKDPYDLKVIDKSSWSTHRFPGEWGMVLIDHEELVVHRFAQLFKLHQNAKVVVFHDANRIEELGISWGLIHALYRHVYFFDRYFPTTVILSNFVDPSEWFN